MKPTQSVSIIAEHQAIASCAGKSLFGRARRTSLRQSSILLKEAQSAVKAAQALRLSPGDGIAERGPSDRDAREDRP